MNRKITILLVICMCLLAACASLENYDAPPQLEQEETPDEVRVRPAYTFEPACSAERIFYSEDEEKKELARYAYVLCTLSITNADALSAVDASAAERNVEAFNARMNSLLNEFIGHGLEMGNDAVSLYVQDSGFFDNASFYEDVSSQCYLAGEVVSVRLDSSSYTGGAHPNSYTSSYLFDLRGGQFIDATQLAEDPEAFRTGVAELLREKADAIQENQGSYWQEYEETLSRWNEGTVLFDGEGMLVVYSPYDLGPYAMGTVELRLSYEELSGLIGQSGLERLGAAEE